MLKIINCKSTMPSIKLMSFLKSGTKFRSKPFLIAFLTAQSLYLFSKMTRGQLFMRSIPSAPTSDRMWRLPREGLTLKTKLIASSALEFQGSGVLLLMRRVKKFTKWWKPEASLCKSPSSLWIPPILKRMISLSKKLYINILWALKKWMKWN